MLKVFILKFILKYFIRFLAKNISSNQFNNLSTLLLLLYGDGHMI